MMNVKSYGLKLKKIVVTTLLTSLLVSGFVIPSTPAFAAGCAAGTICGDIGDNNDGGSTPGTGGGTETGGGNTGGGNTGGGGGNPDPFMWSVRSVPDSAGGGLSCRVRDDGKAALGADYIYTKRFAEGLSEIEPPDVSHYWTYLGWSPGFGFLYERNDFVAKNCLYPPRTYTTSVRCLISNTLSVDMTRPQDKPVMSVTKGAGYSEGSRDYNACVNSSGKLALDRSLTEFGFYKLYGNQRVATATVEVATTINEVTGQLPAPKIIALSPAFNTGKRQINTASGDCVNGWRNPGLANISDYTMTPCNNENSKNPLVTCSAQPIRVDTADGSKVSMTAFTGKEPIEFMRDGKPRKIIFNQSVSGSGWKTNSYSTTFLRSANSTPWDTSKLYNNNEFELRKTETGSPILSQGQGTKTGTMGGKVDSVFSSGYQASDPGSHTTITQKLKVSGTYTSTQQVIDTVDINTGAMTYKNVVVTKNTSVDCNQSVNLLYKRVIGDKIG